MDDVIICRCEEVKRKEMKMQFRLSVRMDELKRCTRAGMAFAKDGPAGNR